MKKLSIRDISLRLSFEDKELLYGQFLDDFYGEKDSDQKFHLICEEPVFDQNNVIFMCILAGTAQKLANDYGLKVPEWVKDSRYTLQYKYYAFNTRNEEFQKYLEETTPLEYKNRNLMVGETILDRC